MGAHLAKMEAKIVLAEIIACCEQISTLPNVEKKPINSTVSFGYESYPMKFTRSDSR